MLPWARWVERARQIRVAYRPLHSAAQIGWGDIQQVAFIRRLFSEARPTDGSNVAGIRPTVSNTSGLETNASKNGCSAHAALDAKVDIYSLSADKLEEWVAQNSTLRYRTDQIRHWLYVDKRHTWDGCNIGAKLLAAAKDKFTIGGALRLVTEQVSRDGTRKRVYELADGAMIESVLMDYKDGRKTACISSQAGCAMGCTFCATGQMGFKRQLSVSEIFGQVALFDRELAGQDQRVTNVVFMGMGEPLANFKNVLEAVQRLNEDLNIGMRSMTISTVGVAPKILKLAELNPQVNLAVSLHTPWNHRRSDLMPINKRYDIEKLMEACAQYVGMTKRRITFEYALIAGENDSVETAVEEIQWYDDTGEDAMASFESLQGHKVDTPFATPHPTPLSKQHYYRQGN